MTATRRPFAAVLLAGLLALMLPGVPAPRAQDGPVVVFAAASLKTALDGIAAAWTQKTGRRTAISYAASSALARQLEQGAPAQVFVTADLDWMDYAQTKGLIEPASRSNLLGNRLVLIAPAASAKPVLIGPGFDLGGLVGSGRLATGAVATVPVGKYAKAALEKLGAWEGVRAKLAEAESVRAALVLVSRGEAPYGIVYATDAAADRSVAVIGTFPSDSHPPIVYPAALVKDAGADGKAFLDFLRSAEAKPFYEAQGFSVLY